MYCVDARKKFRLFYVHDRIDRLLDFPLRLKCSDDDINEFRNLDRVK